MFVYMLSMSKEHILVSLFSSVMFSSIIIWLDLRAFYVYSRLKQLCDGFVNSFAISYAGAFSQLIIGLIVKFGLCSFVVACKLRALVFMFVYFNIFLYRLHGLFGVSFIYF
jgi:hypothetical protein